MEKERKERVVVRIHWLAGPPRREPHWHIAGTSLAYSHWPVAGQRQRHWPRGAIALQRHNTAPHRNAPNRSETQRHRTGTAAKKADRQKPWKRRQAKSSASAPTTQWAPPFCACRQAADHRSRLGAYAIVVYVHAIVSGHAIVPYSFAARRGAGRRRRRRWAGDALLAGG